MSSSYTSYTSNKSKKQKVGEDLYIRYEDNKISYIKGDLIHRDERDSNGLTLPAIIIFDPYTGNFVTRYWYQNGLLHREESEGPAIIGTSKVWYNKNLVHRIKGPAVIYSNGMQVWYHMNKMHREDGPAVIARDFIDYYLFGRKLRKDIHKKIVKIILCKQKTVRKKYITKIQALLGNKICDDLKSIVIKYLINN